MESIILDGYGCDYEMAVGLVNIMVAKGIIGKSLADSQIKDILKWNRAGITAFNNLLEVLPDKKYSIIDDNKTLSKVSVALREIQDVKAQSQNKINEIIKKIPKV